MHVLLEFIETSDSNIEVFNHLTNALENHTKISRILNLDTGEISADDHSGEDAVIMENKKMTHSLSPMYRLLLLGAGDVAKYVAEMAVKALEKDLK
mgnify:CR=1 FL=1